eukprot:2488213-Rhodomonas_salina.3
MSKRSKHRKDQRLLDGSAEKEGHLEAVVGEIESEKGHLQSPEKRTAQYLRGHAQKVGGQLVLTYAHHYR